VKINSLSPKEVTMKHVMTVIILCSLVVPVLVLVDSDAWSGCTIEQRIELGKQGYEKDEVEKACSDSGDDFWDTLSRGFATGLANGLTNGLNKALEGSGNNYASCNNWNLNPVKSSDHLIVDFDDPATNNISRCHKGIHGEHHHVQRRILAEGRRRSYVRYAGSES
jgi:hypothetical protein